MKTIIFFLLISICSSGMEAPPPQTAEKPNADNVQSQPPLVLGQISHRVIRRQRSKIPRKGSYLDRSQELLEAVKRKVLEENQ